MTLANRIADVLREAMADNPQATLMRRIKQLHPLRQWRVTISPATLVEAVRRLNAERTDGHKFTASQINAYETGAYATRHTRDLIERASKGLVPADAWPSLECPACGRPSPRERVRG